MTEKEEVIGLLLGDVENKDVFIWSSMTLKRNDKRPDRCEISPEQLAEAAELAEQVGKDIGKDTRVVGWYHSHPHITVLPSHVDLRTQLQYQGMDSTFVGLIFSVFDTDKRTGTMRHPLLGFRATRDLCGTPKREEVFVEVVPVSRLLSVKEEQMAAQSQTFGGLFGEYARVSTASHCLEEMSEGFKDEIEQTTDVIRTQEIIIKHMQNLHTFSDREVLPLHQALASQEHNETMLASIEAGAAEWFEHFLDSEDAEKTEDINIDDIESEAEDGDVEDDDYNDLQPMAHLVGTKVESAERCSQQQFHLGDHVEVIKAFVSDAEPSIQLHVGDQGIVMQIDANGDAQVAFNEECTWIYSDNFDRLQKMVPFHSADVISPTQSDADDSLEYGELGSTTTNAVENAAVVHKSFAVGDLVRILATERTKAYFPSSVGLLARITEANGKSTDFPYHVEDNGIPLAATDLELVQASSGLEEPDVAPVRKSNRIAAKRSSETANLNNQASGTQRESLLRRKPCLSGSGQSASSSTSTSPTPLIQDVTETKDFSNGHMDIQYNSQRLITAITVVPSKIRPDGLGAKTFTAKEFGVDCELQADLYAIALQSDELD